MLNLLFPTVCGICGKIYKNDICPKCNKKLQELNETKIEVVDTKNFNELAYFCKYKGIVRKRLIEYKFYEAGYLYRAFAELLIKNKKIYNFIESYDIIIPVPIHRKRKNKRGYNQTELIASVLSEKIEKELVLDVLEKNKNTRPQSTLNGKQREENSKNVYILKNKEKIQNKKIILLDDIYTTGNTVNECCKILKNAQPKKIGVLCIAKD